MASSRYDWALFIPHSLFSITFSSYSFFRDIPIIELHSTLQWWFLSLFRVSCVNLSPAFPYYQESPYSLTIMRLQSKFPQAIIFAERFPLTPIRQINPSHIIHIKSMMLQPNLIPCMINYLIFPLISAII